MRGPVSSTARWLMGQEPIYDDLLREKKRVEQELQYKQDLLDEVERRHAKVQQKLKKKADEIKFENQSQNRAPIAHHRKRNIDDGGPPSTTTNSSDDESLHESPQTSQPYDPRTDPYRPPIPGSGGGRGFYERHGNTPSNVEIRALDPATGTPIVVERMGPQSSSSVVANPERRYHPSGYHGQEYTGVRVTPKPAHPIQVMGAKPSATQDLVHAPPPASTMSPEALHLMSTTDTSPQAQQQAPLPTMPMNDPSAAMQSFSNVQHAASTSDSEHAS